MIQHFGKTCLHQVFPGGKEKIQYFKTIIITLWKICTCFNLLRERRCKYSAMPSLSTGARRQQQGKNPLSLEREAAPATRAEESPCIQSLRVYGSVKVYTASESHIKETLQARTRSRNTNTCTEEKRFRFPQSSK